MDLGASSGRLVAGAWDGGRFELEEIYRFPNGPVFSGEHYHTDIETLWHEVQEGFDRFGDRFGGGPEAVGVDSWGVDYALVDAAGKTAGLPYHYRDARTAGHMEKVFARVPRERVFELTGIQFMSINTLYQLSAAAEAGELAEGRTLLLTPDLFHFRLTGRRVAEYTIASTTQLLDARARDWSAPLVRALALPPGLLPPVVPPGTVLGPVAGSVAAEAGWGGAVPVVAVGSHDTASAVAAVPELDAASAYISSGTWSLMGVEVPEPVISKASLALNFTNEGGVNGTIRLLKNIMGLWLVQECQRQWEREGRSSSWEDLLGRAEAAPPFASLVDPDAPEFLSPGDMPAALRGWCARTGQPVPSDDGALVRCCLESLALRYRAVLGHLESLTGRRLSVVRVVGGGCRNRLLCQFTADACGRPVVAGPVEATALGNLMVQAFATGRLGSLAEGRAVVAASWPRVRHDPAPGGGAWDEAAKRLEGFITRSNERRT